METEHRTKRDSGCKAQSWGKRLQQEGFLGRWEAKMHIFLSFPLSYGLSNR